MYVYINTQMYLYLHEHAQHPITLLNVTCVDLYHVI